MKVAVLITSFNRRDTTIRCLRALYAQDGLGINFELSVYLVDDKSTDGTSDSISSQFPSVNLIKSDGSAFWNGGMSIAYEQARRYSYDYFLWLNDDLVLHRDSLLRSIETIGVDHSGGRRILCGITCDEFLNRTYGGLVHRSRLFPLRFRLAELGQENCDSLNGNFVLAHRDIFFDVPPFDSAFTHSMGDIDFGLRATSRGHKIVCSSKFVGICTSNSVSGTYRDSSVPIFRRFRELLSPKGLPIGEWLIFCRRHGGYLWPFQFMWPYFKVLIFRS